MTGVVLRLAAPALVVLTVAACGGTDAPTTGSVPLATAPLATGTQRPSASATPAASPGGLVIVAPGAQVTVIAPLGLNMRAGPSTASAVLGGLAQGAVLTVLGHQTGWYSVQGATKQGFVTDKPQFLSPRHFNTFSSSTSGFTVLYPDTWTFSETATGVDFRPQTGPQVMTVTTAATVAALGAPGRPGYALVATDATEVYGVTGVVRTYDATAGGSPATSAAIAPTASAAATTPPPSAVLAHLEEIRLQVKTTFAMQIDYEYSDVADLAAFLDMVNSIYLPAASVTPAPVASPTH